MADINIVRLSRSTRNASHSVPTSLADGRNTRNTTWFSATVPEGAYFIRGFLLICYVLVVSGHTSHSQ